MRAGSGGEVPLAELPLSDPVILDGKRKAGKSKGTKDRRKAGGLSGLSGFEWPVREKKERMMY